MSMEKDVYDDIGKLLREGWSIRVKTVKGRDYLSARKGNDEKGLGPLTEEVRKYLEELYHPSDKSENTGAADPEPKKSYDVTLTTPQPEAYYKESRFQESELGGVLLDIKFERARVKAVDCEHSFSGLCHYWRFMKGSERLQAIYGRFNAKIYKFGVIPKSGDSRDVYCVTELLCLDCDRYEPRKET